MYRTGSVKKSAKESDSSGETKDSKTKSKSSGKKRKRRPSDSSSCSSEDILPDNMLLLENKVHASAVKNNMDDTCVRKILKKVVTNNKVLALVKMKEQKEEAMDKEENDEFRPKLTRAKARELKKVLPRSTAWNLDKLRLTPIKHIPIKTRPEVEALIAQELPEDEDDEEYEPTNEDAVSDDDQTLESCSEIDSQPQTPATPCKGSSAGPMLVTDGPFKVPQEMTSATKRKLELENEATIALRTRSKLCLSETSIEHIESTFVPPDDLPPDVVDDDVWNQFLEECLNPVQTTRNEEDDEADPEYNAAADPDANEEDEEALSNSIIRISKKELNDLVTELFNVMPDAAANEDYAGDLAMTVLTNKDHSDVPHLEGKQEPPSDDEENQSNMSARITFEKTSFTRLSIGKTETEHPSENLQAAELEQCDPRSQDAEAEMADPGQCNPTHAVSEQLVTDDNRDAEENGTENDPGDSLSCFLRLRKPRNSNQTKNDVSGNEPDKRDNKMLNIAIEERENTAPTSYIVQEAPPLLKNMATEIETHEIYLNVDSEPVITPEQILILAQQIRQHIQIAATNFLQLYVHPLYWSYAPSYKEYLETFLDMTKNNPRSVTSVCNLKPAMELMKTWENTVSENTPQNKSLVEFVQKELEKNRRNAAQNHLYVGNFPDIFMEVVANSPVFLYPHLLPPIPYRAEAHLRRVSYLPSEDSLIVLGLDQFCQYVEANPDLYKGRRKASARHRTLMTRTVHLVAKHMFPWMSAKMLTTHISHIRKSGDKFKSNPLSKFLKNREVIPVQHRLLPFNPSLTLYEQPEVEMATVWLKYLSRNSSRFKTYWKHQSRLCKEPEGVPVLLNQPGSLHKEPLPIDFTREIANVKHRWIEKPENVYPVLQDKYDIDIGMTNEDGFTNNVFELVETSNGPVIMPVKIAETSQTNSVSCLSAPITTPAEIKCISTPKTNLPEISRIIKRVPGSEHCTCCMLLRKICKRQTTILEYFKRNNKKKCYCSDIKYPKISNRLKLLLSHYKNRSQVDFFNLESTLKMLRELEENSESVLGDYNDVQEIAYVLSFQTRLIIASVLSPNAYLKARVQKLFATFAPDGEPATLCARLADALAGDLYDFYAEFAGFLTAEQADAAGMFHHYFRRVCLKKLLHKAQEEVKQKEHLINILTEIREMFCDNKYTACDMCTRLIENVKDYPRLAEYVFSLFPHRKDTESPENTVEPEKLTLPPDQNTFKKRQVVTKTSEQSSKLEKTHKKFNQNISGKEDTEEPEKPLPPVKRRLKRRKVVSESKEEPSEIDTTEDKPNENTSRKKDTEKPERRMLRPNRNRLRKKTVVTETTEEPSELDIKDENVNKKVTKKKKTKKKAVKRKLRSSPKNRLKMKKGATKSTEEPSELDITDDNPNENTSSLEETEKSKTEEMRPDVECLEQELVETEPVQNSCPLPMDCETHAEINVEETAKSKTGVRPDEECLEQELVDTDPVQNSCPSPMDCETSTEINVEETSKSNAEEVRPDEDCLEQELVDTEPVMNSSPSPKACEPHTEINVEEIAKSKTGVRPDEECLGQQLVDIEPGQNLCPSPMYCDTYTEVNFEENDDLDNKSDITRGSAGEQLMVNPLIIEECPMNEEESNSEEERKPDLLDGNTEYSMIIVCQEDDEIKEELSEWKRDEDKLILEVLNQHLTTNEEKNKTILEIISESNMLDLLSDSLIHKSKEEIKERVFYLLNILLTQN